MNDPLNALAVDELRTLLDGLNALAGPARPNAAVGNDLARRICAVLDERVGRDAYAGLRKMYADNGAQGANERHYVTGETRFRAGWNPLYCIYGWAHVIHPVTGPDRCWRCKAVHRA